MPKWQILILAVLYLLWPTSTPVADFNARVSAHHLGDYFPIDRQYFPLEQNLERTGVWGWTYQQRCSSGDILGDIARAFDDTSARYQVLFLYGFVPGQANISTCAADFIGSCGSQATACVGSNYPGYPLNCDAKYDGPYMETFWFLESRTGVVKHELQHCMTRRAEAYDDNYSDNTPYLRCIESDTIMGCGPNSPDAYTAHDDLAWDNEHHPPPVRGAALVGSTAWYARTSDRATRLAVYFRLPDGFTYWSGQYAVPCTSEGIVCGGYNVVGLGSCTEVLLDAQNALPGTWGRNLVSAGSTSCS